MAVLKVCFFFWFCIFLKFNFEALFSLDPKKLKKKSLQKNTSNFRQSLSKRKAHFEMRYSCYPTLHVKKNLDHSDPVWDPTRHKVGEGSAESELFEAEGGSPAPKPKPKVRLARVRLKWKGFHCPTRFFRGIRPSFKFLLMQSLSASGWFEFVFGGKNTLFGALWHNKKTHKIQHTKTDAILP